MSADIAKCTITSFTSTKCSVKITTAFSIMVMEKTIYHNKSDICFGTSSIIYLKS